MNTAPRGVLVNLHLEIRRIVLQELAVIGDPRQLSRFDILHRVSERHLSVSMMVAIRLAVSRDVHELGPGSAIGECAR